MGEEMAPWGTPARIGAKFETTEPTLVVKNLFSRYDLKISSRVEVELFLVCVGDQGAELINLKYNPGRFHY